MLGVATYYVISYFINFFSERTEQGRSLSRQPIGPVSRCRFAFDVWWTGYPHRLYQYLHDCSHSSLVSRLASRDFKLVESSTRVLILTCPLLVSRVSIFFAALWHAVWNSSLIVVLISLIVTLFRLRFICLLRLNSGTAFTSSEYY